MSTWPASAPMARRMPISRVRSVTDTSMMFMMPMPPTSRLTPATADKQPGEHAGDAGQHRGDLRHVEDAEIVALADADMAPFAQAGPRCRLCTSAVV